MIAYQTLLLAASRYYGAKARDLNLSKTSRNDALTLKSRIDVELEAAQRGEPLRVLEDLTFAEPFAAAA